MHELHGKVAVVTGAASGIGRALAQAFAERGMRLVVADVEQEPLDALARELGKTGADVLAHVTDVASRSAVFELAHRAHERFGVVHILCNNAGVTTHSVRPIWESDTLDWEWVLGVNLMGVVHGLQAFMPAMLAHGEEGYVLNTASILGLVAGRGSIYAISKHAVVRLSEGVYQDLKAQNARLCVGVLCPGMVATQIVQAERNRPQELRQDRPAIEDVAPELAERWREAVRRFSEEGMPPERVAEIVLEAMRERRFYILTHSDINDLIQQRTQRILSGGVPPDPKDYG